MSILSRRPRAVFSYPILHRKNHKGDGRPGQACGENGKIYPLDVAVGDCVSFGKWSGTEIALDGEQLIIIKEADLMGVVKKTVQRKAA